MKKIRTVLPTTSNNNYIPNNVLALNVKDNNAYYKHNNKLFKIPLNNNSDKPSYEDIIYGIKFKVLDKSVYEAHKDELNGIYSEGIYSERVAYKVTVINHFDTGVQEIVHAELVENNKRWEPCLDGEGGINDFEDVYPFCYMKKYINRGDTYKLEIDKLIEFDNVTVTQEEKENSDHYTCLPVFFKSVTFPSTEWWDDQSNYETRFARYFISSQPYKVNIPDDEYNRDAWDEEYSCLSDFYCVESHRIINNLNLIGENYIDIIFISSYNINMSDTNLKPGEAVLPIVENNVLNDPTTIVPNKIYETYLEFIWSIKIGHPCLQGCMNDILNKLYNKKIDYLSYNKGFLEADEEYAYTQLYSYNFQFNAVSLIGSRTQFKITSFLDFNNREPDNKVIPELDNTNLYNILNEKFKVGKKILMIVYNSVNNRFKIIKNTITSISRYGTSVTYISVEDEVEYEDGDSITIPDVYIESGTTLNKIKDGLYNDVILMDNIENPHIFSKYPTYIGTKKYADVDNFYVIDNNFMYHSKEEMLENFLDPTMNLRLGSMNEIYADMFTINYEEEVYSENLYKEKPSYLFPSYINSNAISFCNITGTQILRSMTTTNITFIESLSELFTSYIESSLHLFKKIYYTPGYVFEIFGGDLYGTTRAISCIEINIEHSDYNGEISHVQVTSPSLDIYSIVEPTPININFGLTRRILLSF